MKTIFRLIVRLGIIAIILVGIQKVLTTPRYLQAIMPYVNQVEELLEKRPIQRNIHLKMESRRVKYRQIMLSMTITVGLTIQPQSI